MLLGILAILQKWSSYLLKVNTFPDNFTTWGFNSTTENHWSLSDH